MHLTLSLYHFVSVKIRNTVDNILFSYFYVAFAASFIMPKYEKLKLIHVFVLMKA